MSDKQRTDFDAYCHAREVRDGCQHMLGCRCDVPFWLREPTPAELEHYYEPRKAAKNLET